MKMSCTNLHSKGVIKKKSTFLRPTSRRIQDWGGPTFALQTQKYNTFPFKQMLASRLFNMFNVPGSNHEEVSTNRDTFFVCYFLVTRGVKSLFLFFPGGEGGRWNRPCTYQCF